MDIDFGSNAAAGTTTGRNKKQAENFGILTIELPNGQRLDGYVLLSEKNLAKLGISVAQAKEFGSTAKSVSGTKLHVQFGDREVKLAEPVIFD